MIPAKSSTRRRTHGDFDDFLATLPAQHREACKDLQRDMDTQVMEMHLVEGMIMPDELTQIGNMIQLAIGQGLTQQRGIVRGSDFDAVIDLDPDYWNAREVMITAQVDLAGPLTPHDCFLRHVEPPDEGRIPAPERQNISMKGVNPNRIKRAWIMAVNENVEHEGGIIYFPTKMTGLKLGAGAALIFNPDLPYGVSPVESGVRRFMMGWASDLNVGWVGGIH